ncbi:MAG: phosphatase PAP2 family protein [Kiritimatiellaeota bacterium]|nr:phosphatase PAP2 family protein [Kiritimatiellota bacterium]
MTLAHWAQLVSNHAQIAYALVFLAAFSESLALVGLIIPGTTMMFAAGVVVSTGALMPGPVFLLAVLGAIAGDGASYWLGHRYRDRLRSVWPLRRHPEVVARGEAYFFRHGGKSVFLGRFVGPVRPIIPMIAGMLGMAPTRFAVSNLLSAVGWATAALLPGILFGASLNVAGRVSARLSILMLLLLAIGWSLFLGARKLTGLIGQIAPRWFALLRSWAGSATSDVGLQNRIKGFVKTSLAGANGEPVLLFFLMLSLVLAVWGFFGVLQDVLARDPLVYADRSVYHFLQSLRNPTADSFFTAVTELGDGFTNFCVAGTISLVLLAGRRFRTLAYWLAVIVGGAVLVVALKYALLLPRPEALYHGAGTHGFPSGHTAMNVIIYGFLAILLARELGNRVRVGLFAAVLTISSLVAFSRLYLGVHWLSDVLGGWLLALGWVSLMGIVYLERIRNTSEVVPRRGLAAAVLFAVIAAGAWHISARHARDMTFYAPQRTVREISRLEWLAGGWRDLPIWRTDLGGEMESPLDIQLIGPLDALDRVLANSGWRPAPPLTPAGLLSMLAPGIPVAELPILPRLHLGRFEQRILVRRDRDCRRILRLWATNTVLQNDRSPIWVGTVGRQTKIQVVGWVSFARTDPDADSALEEFESETAGLVLRRVRRTLSTRERLHDGLKWNGTVLLMGPSSPNKRMVDGR